MERRVYSAEYEQLTPRERNREFRKIYDAFPYNVYVYEDLHIDKGRIDFDEHSDRVLRILMERQESEHYKALEIKLSALLDYALICPQFREILEDQKIPGWYVTGIMKDPLEHELTKESGLPEEPLIAFEKSSDDSQRWLWIFDEDHPESGGIFDPERIKYLERKGYRQFVEQVLGIRKPDKEIEGTIFGLFSTDVKTPPTEETKETMLLKEWRQSFVSRFGEEP